MPPIKLLAALLLFSGISTTALAQNDATRGELLYSKHCDACHGSQIHWREQKHATDWQVLLTEVRRWEAFSRLGWDEDDIQAVARYLNDLYYHYPTGN